MSPQNSGNSVQLRKLAAIMFTDLAAFSAVMDRNEAEGLKIIRKNRELHQSAIENHGGQLLKEMGDGMLATFHSALESVRCAMEIQDQAKEQNLELPIRIGLHLGDINIENEDIFGDGVNVASRLQSMADPGGIYISESIHNAIHSQPDLQSKYLGEIRLKNIAEPVRTYALQSKGLPAPDVKRLARFVVKPTNIKAYRKSAIIMLFVLAVLAYWFIRTYEIEKIVTPKSIAVLPLENLSTDPDKDYLSSGMTDALIRELSKASPLTVIAQRSTRVYEGSILPISQIAMELNGVDYIVKGTVNLSDNLLITKIQLIDPGKDKTLWEQRYEDDISNTIQMWSLVARDLIRQLPIKIPDEDAVLWKDIRKVNPETYELYLKGMQKMNTVGFEAHISEGMVYLKEAIDKNPTDPLAYAGLAHGHVVWGHGPNPRPNDWDKVRAYSIRAIQLDSTLAEAWSALADYKMYGEHDWESAEKLFQKVDQLNPSLSVNHFQYAWYLAIFGRMDEAIEEHIRAKELDPLTSANTAWLGELYNYVGEYDKAIVEARASMELDDKVMGLLVLGNAYLGKGMMEEAIKTHEELVFVAGDMGYFWLGPTYLAAGRIEDGKKILKKLEEFKLLFYTITIASMYIQLGDFDKAFEALKFKPRQAWFPGIRVFPMFKPLHDDPRFKEIMRELNLPDPAPFIYNPKLHS